MKNKIFKYIGLEVLLLLALMLCGTIVVKIFNVALKLQFESIGTTGFIAGLCAWLILLIGWGILLSLCWLSLLPQMNRQPM